LGALEVVPAMQAGAQHKVSLQQGARPRENVDDLLLAGIHAATVGDAGQKTKSILLVRLAHVYAARGVIKNSTLLLEDEVGDVLEKAMRRGRFTAERVAERANVALGKFRDALDYRSDLTCDELRRVAGVLGLNEVGLCALGTGRYPTPEIGALPFCVWPLRMAHGIGVANAYLVGECGARHAILFDTGAGIDALRAEWPSTITKVDAVFLTHVEPEHTGGLCDIVKRFSIEQVFVPVGAKAPCGLPMAEGEKRQFGRLEVSAFTTPGHAAAHSCYLVRSTCDLRANGVLISGDLVFAGSVGGAYFSHEQLQSNLGRMLRLVPPQTVIAPGHGPLTTAENELRYNPFVL
jgi:hydroxyacylglutathione hydrolase